MSLNAQIIISRLKRYIWMSVDNYIYARRPCSSCKTIPLPPEFEYWIISDMNHLSGNKDDGKLRYLLGKGCNVYLAGWNGEIAGRYVSCKLSQFKPYAYNEHGIFLEEESYYVFHCRTYEPFRGKGIFPLMLSQICRDICRDDPHSIIYSSADVANMPSQRAIDKAGFHRIGHLKHMTILNHPVISRIEAAPNAVL